MPVPSGTLSEARAPVVVARQPGSATAFVPVVRQLVDNGLVPLVFGYPLARPAFAELDVVCHPINTFDAAAPYLGERAPAWVLTGTSLDVADDARWWNLASRLGVRSVGFVDQWVNYWQRFTTNPRGEPQVDTLPDVVAVIDEVARSRLVGYGAPADRVVVSGTPALDLLAPAAATAGAAIRAGVAVGAGERVVLFAAEPEPEEIGPSASRALALLVETLEGLGRPAVVLVRPHPRQAHEAGAETLPRSRGCVRVLAASGDRLALLHAADVVAGVESMLLYEATQAGRPAVSLRLDQDRQHDLADHPGIESVCHVEEAATVLRRALEAAPARCTPAVGRATLVFLERLGLDR